MRAIQPPHIKYVISGGLAVVLGLALLLTLVVFQGAAQATTLTVTNTNDSGAGSRGRRSQTRPLVTPSIAASPARSFSLQARSP